MAELFEHNITPISVVACNLYPFQETVAKPNVTLKDALENIDIGGVTLIRAAAKNFEDVLVLTDPNDYKSITDLQKINGNTRQRLALKAFQHTTSYDSAISRYLGDLTGELPADQKSEDNNNLGESVNRNYTLTQHLKYGCNPHQKKAGFYSIDSKPVPFSVLNGNPGYINIIDAANSWFLVKELSTVLDRPSAASFKHTSPAGVAISQALTLVEKEMFDLSDAQFDEITPMASAFIRARNVDPKSSFGDFISLSDTCDLSTAMLIKRYVSDGVIAPGYEPEALEVLKTKKKGNYLILQSDPNFEIPKNTVEYREIGGMCVSQQTNYAITDFEWTKPENRVTKNQNIPESSEIDLIIANISLKYTQSNSVSTAFDGKLLAAGAGQQSRIDCVAHACRKSEIALLRSHPRVLALNDIFKLSVKRTERTNAITDFIENNFTKREYQEWIDLFESSPPNFLNKQEISDYINGLPGISMASDALMPFPDSIHQASKMNVKYILQPGGAVRDSDVISAADKYNMVLINSGIRVFTH